MANENVATVSLVPEVAPRKNERARAMKEAIRQELQILLESDLTIDTLGRIGQICGYGESIIKAIEAPVGAAVVTPIDLKRSLEQAQIAFACSNNDVQPPLLPEQTPGETVAVRLLKELIAIFRPQFSTAAQTATPSLPPPTGSSS